MKQSVPILILLLMISSVSALSVQLTAPPNSAVYMDSNSINFKCKAVGNDLIQLPISINMPFSAFMFVNPLIASLILTYKDYKFAGIKELLKRSFHHKGIKKKWYVPIFLLMPAMMFLAYLTMLLLGSSVETPSTM